MSELSSKRCVPCRGGVPPLRRDAIIPLLNQLDGWDVVNDDFRHPIRTVALMLAGGGTAGGRQPSCNA